MKWGGGSGSAVLPGVQSIIMDALMSFLGMTKGVLLGPPNSPGWSCNSDKTPCPYGTSSITLVSGLG